METKEQLNTKGYMSMLLDHEHVFGVNKPIEYAINLIKDIPTITAVNFIARINYLLYLNDSAEKGFEKQADLLKDLKATNSLVANRLIECFIEAEKERKIPSLFYRYSNLEFCDLIFTHYNTQLYKHPTKEDIDKLLTALLIVNKKVNDKIKIEEGELEKAIEQHYPELVLLPQFIYQSDYKSNVDFSNQLVRGYYFFKFLETHPDTKNCMQEYYKNAEVSDAENLLRHILLLYNDFSRAKHSTVKLAGELDADYNRIIKNLCINSSIKSYDTDNKHSMLRRQMFYFVPHDNLILLDIGFLIDQLYKAQTFSLRSFFYNKGVKKYDQIKTTEFMEQYFFDKIMNACFPTQEKFNNLDLKSKNKKQLIDYVVKDGTKILLIEFKDVLLSADAKHSADATTLFAALDLNLISSKSGKPKGLGQLMNAIQYIDKMPVEFNNIISSSNCIIYPIVAYTDNSMDFDGIIKVYNQKFRSLLEENSFSNLQVKDLTLINLSYFEFNEYYLANKQINIFEMIDNYHSYVRADEDSMTPFAVYATQYRKKHIPAVQESTPLCKQVLQKLLTPTILKDPL